MNISLGIYIIKINHIKKINYNKNFLILIDIYILNVQTIYLTHLGKYFFKLI